MIFCISSYNFRVDREVVAHLSIWSTDQGQNIQQVRPQHTKKYVDSTCVSFSKIFVCVCVEKILSFVSFWGLQVLCHSDAQVATCPVASTLQHTHTQQNETSRTFPTKHLGFPRKNWTSQNRFPTHSANDLCNHPKQKCQCSHWTNFFLRHEASQKRFPRRLLQKIGPSHVPYSIQCSKIPSLDWLLPTICKVFRMMYPSRRSFQYHVFYIIIA